MQLSSLDPLIEESSENRVALEFCNEFLRGQRPRYVFGCNEWARSIARQVDVDGFVDDFVEEKFFEGKPVIRSQEAPKAALVVSAVVGVRPLTALKRIREQGLVGIDYFAFQKYSGLTLKEVMFLGEFENDFRTNRQRYDRLFERLNDAESRRILSRLINFRLSRNICHMDGFVDAQARQYFEPFLKLQTADETFLDVGCYDGYTSEEFIRRCPGYRSIHAFEPEPSNMLKVRSRLAQHRNIHYHPYGASDRAQVLQFKADGSASMVCEGGGVCVRVVRIDDVIQEPYSFLKMDIEGGEVPALQGAARTIAAYQPRMAISVYHKADDLWRIPELLLSVRSDYDIYLRHYTEGVTETVMFFVPREQS